MPRWWNVYIGGPESGGHGWTPEVVRAYARQGIDRFMLTYVGRQHNGPLTRSQGQADGREALKIARSFGYGGSVPLCLDVELHTFESAPSQTVEYTRAWCATVRDGGARPGVYANPGPLKAMAQGKVPAEFVWIASWVSHGATPHDPHAATGMPAGLWGKQGQRAWQYAGAFGNQSCNVLGLNVDINVADLGCLAPAPGVAIKTAARPRLVRRGDKGELVERLTGRLSYVQSKKTGEPYLDGSRGVFDAETESAVKAFQADHGMTASGTYGRGTARALRRAVSLRKARRKQAAKGSATAPVRTRPRLQPIAKEVRRLDAETDRAWKELVARGHKQGRRLAELRARPAAARDPGLSELTAVLLRIEDKLQVLVEAERREAPYPPEQAPAEAVEATVGGGDAPYPPAQTSPSQMRESPPPDAGSNGGGDPPPTPTRRKLTELSDTELERRIGHLDEALDRARTVLMRRFARAERELAVLDPPRPVEKKKPKPKVKDKVKPKPKPEVPSHPAPSHHTEGVRDLQRSLNKFSGRYLEDVGPLIVDGVKGHATNRRIRTTKYYLGYEGKAQRSSSVKPDFVRRMRHPRSARYSSPAMLTRAATRRRAHRKAAKLAAAPRAGVAKFDNRPVAAWLKPYLDWARANGWQGTVNSGWRDPAYSERLCQAMCGQPSCPGKCAGRSSNHSGSTPGRGAVDVSDYVTFGRLMQRCPHSPRIFNALGAQDPVHFSASGR